MAEYYWVGGATATSGSYTNNLGNFSGKTGAANMNWVLAFDWNNPNNWWKKNVYGNNGLSGASGGFSAIELMSMAQDCPSYGDIAYFGQLGEPTAPFPGWTMPNKAVAPCLWGGASQSGITITWLGGTGDGSTETGLTFNSALSQLTIESMNTADSHYPFAWIGYSSGLEYVGSGDRHSSPLLDADFKGFTLDSSIWGETSWETLAAAVAATGGTSRLNQLRVKTPLIVGSPYAGSMDNTVRNQGVVDIDSIKNIAQLNGGSGGATAEYVNTVIWARGTMNYKLSGYFMRIDREVRYDDVEFTKQVGFYHAEPRRHLELKGVIAGKVDGSYLIGTVYTDSTSNIAEMSLIPTSNLYSLNIGNDFQREYVMSQIGNYGATAGGNTAPVENLHIYTVVPNLHNIADENLVGMQDRLGVVLGTPGATMMGNIFRILSFQFPNLPPISLKFGGSVSVNKIYAEKCDISARSNITLNSVVEVAEFHLKRGCTMNFAANSAFDGWRFGVQNGYAINGGIIFDNDGSQIKGSVGVKLWNDTLLLNGSQFAGDASGRDGAKSSNGNNTITGW